MNPSCESELIARCRSGEATAWDEFFERHYAATARFIYQLGAEFSHEDVEEICQEVFISVIRNISSFHGHSQVQTWIFRIAVNKSRDFRERHRAAKRGGGQVVISLQAESSAHDLTLDPPSASPNPGEQLLRDEDWALVRKALERLGDPCHEIIELRYFGDLSYEEIAQVLRLNQKTVSSRLSKCLDRLEMIARPILRPGKSKWEKPAPFSV